MSWWTSTLPVLTLGLGWAGSELSESRRASRARADQSADRAEIRTDEAADRRKEFELRTLTELFDALSKLARLVTIYYLADTEAAKQTGKPYGAHRLPAMAETDEQLRLTNVQIHQLTLMCLDPKIRDAVDQATAAMAMIAIGTKSIEDAERAYDSAMLGATHAQELIATRIRSLYGGE